MEWGIVYVIFITSMHHRLSIINHLLLHVILLFHRSTRSIISFINL